MLKQPRRSPRPRLEEAKRGEVPCRARRHEDLQSDFLVAWVTSTPLPPRALACSLALNCGCGLLLRNTGGDLRLLPIDTAKADIAIGPSWARRERLAIYLRHRKARRTCRQQHGAAVRFKSQPPCSARPAVTLALLRSWPDRCSPQLRFVHYSLPHRLQDEEKVRYPAEEWPRETVKYSIDRERKGQRRQQAPGCDVVHRPSASPTTRGGSGQSSVSQMARSSSASRTVTCWFARMQAAQATTIRRLMAGTD